MWKQKHKEENSIVTEIDTKDFSVYVDGSKELIVEYDFDTDNIKNATIYDIQGRKVAAFIGNQSKSIANLKTGILSIWVVLHLQEFDYADCIVNLNVASYFLFVAIKSMNQSKILFDWKTFVQLANKEHW